MDRNRYRLELEDQEGKAYFVNMETDLPALDAQAAETAMQYMRKMYGDLGMMIISFFKLETHPIEFSCKSEPRQRQSPSS